jgi:hypothetical protein
MVTCAFARQPIPSISPITSAVLAAHRSIPESPAVSVRRRPRAEMRPRRARNNHPATPDTAYPFADALAMHPLLDAWWHAGVSGPTVAGSGLILPVNRKHPYA